jgi:hypothetical protein
MLYTCDCGTRGDKTESEALRCEWETRDLVREDGSLVSIGLNQIHFG